MEVIFLFRRLVFAMVLLGIVTFCMAEANPGLLLLVGSLVALSWYVVEGPTGRPLPQWVIRTGAVAALVWLMLDLYWQRGNVIPAMGHFIIWLQVLLLYARKSNREYAQLLALSLMQMASAGVLTASILFALLLGVYCFLALFAVLLFQLKVTADKVAAASQAAAPRKIDPPRPKPVVGRGHRWHFRITGLVIGGCCALIALLFFLITPRADHPFMNGYGGDPTGTHQVGFSPYVELNGGPIEASDRSPVLNMNLTIGGQPTGAVGDSWLLRGIALDSYSPNTHIWSRSSSNGPFNGRVDRFDNNLEPKADGYFLAPISSETPQVQAQITLRMLSDRVLFTLGAPSFFQSAAIKHIKFNGLDQLLSLDQGTRLPLTYHIRSPVEPPLKFFDGYEMLASPRMGRSAPVRIYAMPSTYATGWTVETERVRTWALAVLAPFKLTRNPMLDGPGPDDMQIAQTLAAYMRENFRYTLANPPPTRPEDPVVDFLLNRKAGHCELFASGLAAALRSLGIRSRVIAGFRVAEFNQVGQYYVVRQSDAHSWTEAWCGDNGWVALDATPALAVREEHSEAEGTLGYLRDLYGYLDFAWLNNVASYNDDSRQNLMASMNQSFETLLRDQDSWVGRLAAWCRRVANRWEFDALAYIIMGVTAFFVAVALFTLVRILLARARRRSSLQLNRLSRKEQRELTASLRFYLQMLDSLDRYGYIRPQWQSPFAFATQLAQADPVRFAPVIPLTEVFYEVRFGHRPLDAERESVVRAQLRQLDAALSGKRKGASLA